MIQKLVEVDCERTRELVRGLRPPYLIFKFDATEDEYFHLADEDFRCEYVDGVIVMHSPASTGHEQLLMFLNGVFTDYVLTRRLGLLFGSNTVMQVGTRRFCPDLSFLATEHANRVGEQLVDGAFDLLVEVLSLSTRRYDLHEKRPAYQEAGVREIWFIDPGRREVHVDFLTEQGYESVTLVTGRLESRVIDGLVVNVDWFWSDPLPVPRECVDGMSPPNT